MLDLTPKNFVSWDEPIEMLYACHSRVKTFCKQLAILPDYLNQHGLNQAVKNDVQQILNYFNQAAPLHHDDEEKDFFPELVKVVPSVQAEIDALEAQHIHLHENWAKLAVQLTELLNGERENVELALIQQFIAGYDTHIAIEEPLFELGKQHLAAARLAQMGKTMFDRRKVSNT